MKAKKVIDHASARPLSESLAESRMSLLRLARIAREGKNTSLARELTAKAEALKFEIARLRRQNHAQWDADARRVRSRLNALDARLEEALHRASKPEELSRKGIGILKIANDAARLIGGLGR